ncbi:MAG: hypothetical protein A3G22_06905 [Alphaproteobacteria bacterium RIFCSPLOWO2_12_FULL_40_11]|nr:MAG: hypothetical protein A3G22_06905 [Alphaproteobacteria bacterium RIFCSPLOWO2_12_FULL_40_11]
MLFSKNIFAQQLVEKFHDWNVFKSERGDRIVCYTASTPTKREGNYDKRGEPFFLVTNIEDDADEISASSGFIYNQNSNVEVSFATKKFYLFPYKAMAWANDKNDDIDIIKEMQKSSDMIITGIARDGKIAVDTYSLIGFAASYRKLKEVCEDLR